MELSKNLYIMNSQDVDDDSDDVYVRIKHFDWQRYNDNAKRIKIKNLELERLKRIRVEVDDSDNYDYVNKPGSKTRITIEFFDKSNSNNKKNIEPIEKDLKDTNSIEKIKDINETKNIIEDKKEEQDKDNHIDNAKEIKLENKENKENKEDSEQKSNNKKKEEVKNDDCDFTSVGKQPIKVFASQVKNPLEWIFTDNEYLLDEKFKDMHMRLASYVIGTLGGTGLGLFLMSTAAFPTLGLVIIIYANLPKEAIKYTLKVLGKFIGFDFSKYYKNLTDFMIQYAENSPNRIKDKIKRKEEKLKEDRRIEEFVEKRMARYRQLLAEKKKYQEVMAILNKSPRTRIVSNKDIEKNDKNDKKVNNEDNNLELLYKSNVKKTTKENKTNDIFANEKWADKMYLEKLFMPQEENSLSLPEKPKSNKSS